MRGICITLVNYEINKPKYKWRQKERKKGLYMNTVLLKFRAFAIFPATGKNWTKKVQKAKYFREHFHHCITHSTIAGCFWP